MKLIIAILLFTIGAFAQNTTYKDGTDCECDSIHYVSKPNFIYELPYKHGKLNGVALLWFFENTVITQKYNSSDFYINRSNPIITNDYISEPILVGLLHYKNGKKDGWGWSCYSDGTRQKTFSYKKGKKDGLEIIYYKNGNPKDSILYKNGNIIK
jgi:antitoxin component YwqK of YwqJK toxin-antitoxin module